ncbi:MAG: ComEC/Rec2 family competence protein [Oscillospiraceae bacterium]|nr:ComEC/Rec2 family competence protein [Oscillospiraceae bacterium]
MERPMATIGFSFFLSLIIASFLELKMNAVVAAVLLAAFITFMCIRSLRQNRRAATVLFAAMAAFSMYSIQEYMTFRPLQKWDGNKATLRVETLDWVSLNRVTVRVLDGDIAKGTRISIYLSGTELDPAPYDILEGEFKLFTPRDSKDGQIRGFSKSQKIYLNAFPAQYGEVNIEMTSPETRPFMYNILNARKKARNVVMSQPGMTDVAGLATGIAFGFRQDISSTIKNDFRVAGVSHLLAVSGLHVTVLSQVLLAFLLLLKVPRRAALSAAGAGVLFFMALTGFTPSVMRAGIMCLVFITAQMIGREPDSVNSLGIAVFAITIFNPYAVNDAGLLLSFSATYGLLALYPKIKRATSDRLKAGGVWARIIARPVNALCITIAATIPTLPVILFTFGQISIISPLANLLMVLPASVVMISTCIAVPLYVFEPLRFISGAVFWAVELFSRYLAGVAELLAGLPMASVWVEQSFMYFGILAAIGLVVLGRQMLGRRGMRVAALWSVIALLCGVLTYGLLMKGVTRITVLSTNDAVMLLERDGRTGVILTGDDISVVAAVNELEKRNVRTVDFLIIPFADDACAFYSMFFTENIGVNCLITGRPGDHTLTVESLPSAGRLSLEDGDIGFWKDSIAELKDDWLRLTIDKTRILVCGYGLNASKLNTDFRQTNLLVLSGPTQHISALTAQAGVLCSMPDTLSNKIKAIPRNSYPIYNTSDNNVTFLTRGRGDITYKGGSIGVD